jgi:hypothetical protein
LPAIHLLLLRLLLVRTLSPWLRRCLPIRDAWNRDEVDRPSQILSALGIVLCPCLHIRICIGVGRVINIRRRAGYRLLGRLLSRRLGLRFRLNVGLREGLREGLRLR